MAVAAGIMTGPGGRPAAAITPTPPAFDITVSKSDSPDPIYAGNTLTYTLTLTFVGDASSFSIVDPLPAGFAFAGDSCVLAGVPGEGHGTVDGNNVWSISASGGPIIGKLTCQVQVVVPGTTPAGTVSNTATFTATGFGTVTRTATTSTQVLTPTPTPFFPTTVVTLTNNTGQPASALSLTFAPPSASLLPVSQNAPGCGTPTYDYGGSPPPIVYSMTIFWPSDCIDPGESVTLTLMTDCPAPLCQAPGVADYSFFDATPGAPATVFCISGTSDAVPWEWMITYGPGPTTVGPGTLGPLPAGQGADAFAAAFAAGINAPPGVFVQQLPAPQSHCFSLELSSQVLFNFFVRTPVGGPGPFCQVTGNPSGCSFNPTITVSSAVGGIVGLVSEDSASAQVSASASGDSSRLPLAAALVALGGLALAGPAQYLRRRIARR